MTNITHILSDFAPDLSSITNLIDPSMISSRGAIGSAIGLGALATAAGLRYYREALLDKAFQEDSPLLARVAIISGAKISLSVLNKALKFSDYNYVKTLLQYSDLNAILSDNNTRSKILDEYSNSRILEFILEKQKKTAPVSQSMLNQYLSEILQRMSFNINEIKKIKLLTHGGADTSLLSLQGTHLRSSILHEWTNEKLLKYIIQIEKKAGRFNKQMLNECLHELCAGHEFTLTMIEKMKHLIEAGAEVNSPSPAQFSQPHNNGPCLSKVFIRPNRRVVLTIKPCNCY